MTRTTHTIELARSWISCDPQGCRDDVARLGRDEAVAYNLELAHDNPDESWHAITLEAMAAALDELIEEG